MIQPGRKYSAGDGYRYGFNGMEDDNEVKGEGNALDFGNRSIYDPRLARFVSLDPKTRDYPWMAPYAYATNNPIFFNDEDGEGPIPWRLKSFLKADSWYITGLLYGIGDGLIETVDVAAGIVETALACSPTIGATPIPNPFFFTDRAREKREEIATFGAAIQKLATDKEMQDKVIEQIKTAFGDWWDAVTLGKTSGEAGYAHGKLLFDVLTSLIGVGEIKTLLTTGKLSIEALAQFKNLKKVKAALDLKGLCFGAGTLILTKHGLIKIENITINDSVWAYNDTTHILSFQKVYQVMVKQTTQFVKIYTGKEITLTTPDHPFWLNNIWTQAKYLRKGDSLSSFSGVKYVIDSIAVQDTIATVYNFAVENFHTYFVSPLNILVHNSNPCAALKQLKYVLKAGVDLDWRGTGKGLKEGLEEAFKRTGLKKEEFEITKWAKDKNGKSIPVEYKAKDGAEVSVDFAHTTEGPDAPHIGYQTGGKKRSGGGVRGHIILDDVPAGRTASK